MAGRRAQAGTLRLLTLALSLLAAALLFAPGVARAQVAEEDVRKIAHQLRCPVCESVSVADSPADLAVQMRAVIRKKLEAGESEQQILEYFRTAYGDSVLLEPPRRGLGLLVWFGPVVMFGAGAVAVGVILKRWVRARASRRDLAALLEAPDADDEAEALARRELEALRRGLER